MSALVNPGNANVFSDNVLKHLKLFVDSQFNVLKELMIKLRVEIMMEKKGNAKVAVVVENDILTGAVDDGGVRNHN